MKAVLLSTRPKWCGKICHEIGTDKNGKPIYEKTIEVRKTKPSTPTPFKVLIYQTKSRNNAIYKQYKVDDLRSGKVIGEFICDKVISTCGWRLRGDTQQCAKRTVLEEEFPRLACLTIDELVRYAGNDGRGIYGWHISQLKIYDKPKALWQFYKCGAKSFEELSNTGEICEYCKAPSQGLYLCEGRFCDETYEAYLDANFTLTRPPQSWCYVQELEERK